MTMSQPRYQRPSPQTQGDLVIRAREPADIDAVADLLQLPQVRYGTLRLPYRSRDEVRRALETPSEAITSLVATHDGEVVGSAALIRDKGRRSHVGNIAIAVHDDLQGRGIGSALLAALIETADRWLNLTRLELTVSVDNERAIRLYRKFDFVEEGVRRADAFRDGVFVDSLAMARVRAPQVD
jgi:L-phenylalanine/L-methionine N-acetyltransferase